MGVPIGGVEPASAEVRGVVVLLLEVFMPELPEVETVARAFDKIATGKSVSHVTFFRAGLRRPFPKKTIKHVLEGERILRVFRRAKYILIKTQKGFGIIHLGMSGKLLFVGSSNPQEPHTHFVLRLTTVEGGGPPAEYIHYVDPRRFGVFDSWAGPDWKAHELLQRLGYEPLETDELGAKLWKVSRGRRVSIKDFIMNARVLVGVGNIYACEALFLAGVDPRTKAGRLSRERFEKLALAICQILKKAISAGGTTLRDYRQLEGDVGSFAVSLFVYGREGMRCLKCRGEIFHAVQSGRTSWFCRFCQK